MIVPRLRSEARGGSSSGSSSRSNNGGVYGGRIHHASDPDLKRALQYSYASQTVRKWEKRWVIIRETSMRVHKWMPAPVSAPASQTVANKTVPLNADNTDKLPEQQQQQQQQEQKQEELDSISISTQDTQMMVDEESTSQSSQN